uniref:Retinal rod rhodopsin-sensitive cGMP 3',5'-cyclic phosphodiesterase subunit gamma n=1 Tax=Paramormyrops kingsleyae TaxID=1676925 RepID=A0A3B3SI75_9TELE
MNLEPPKPEIKSATRVSGGPATPRKGPPKFKQRQTRQFKSKPPKKGIQGFGDDIPGMEGLGTGESWFTSHFVNKFGHSVFPRCSKSLDQCFPARSLGAPQQCVAGSWEGAWGPSGKDRAGKH